MIDGDLITQPTIESIRAGVGSGKPLVLGATDDEFTMVTDRAKNKLRLVPVALALGMLRRRRGQAQGVSRGQRARSAARARRPCSGASSTDMVFRVERRARRRGASGCRPPGCTGSRGLAGDGWACHCLDVPFWFDCLDAERVDAIAGDAPPRALAAALHGSAVAFIRDGEPGLAGVVGRARRDPGVRRRGIPSRRPADGYASVRALV